MLIAIIKFIALTLSIYLTTTMIIDNNNRVGIKYFDMLVNAISVTTFVFIQFNL